jgi:hypothetical protein
LALQPASANAATARMTRNRQFPRAAGAMAVFVLTGLIEAAPARANIVFDFSGVCSWNCGGTPTGVLTLADSYTFGTDITDADFISFDYYHKRGCPAPYGGLNADGWFNSAGGLEVQSSPDYTPSDPSSQRSRDNSRWVRPSVPTMMRLAMRPHSLL